MCEQCMAAAADLGEPIPNFFLVQATQDGYCMKNGEYGLVEMNDPFLIFEMKPYPDPCEGMTDDEVNALCVEENGKMMAWLETARNFEELFEVSPKTGWRFVEACRKAGYTDKDGSVAIWFFHKAGVMLEKSGGLKIRHLRDIPKFNLVENCTLESAQRQADEDSKLLDLLEGLKDTPDPIDYKSIELRFLSQARDRGDLETVLATLPGGDDPAFIERVKERLDRVEDGEVVDDDQEGQES